jgi:hypothetical protein
MLAERETEPSSPRGAEEVRALDAQRVENGDGVANTGGQRVRARLPWLVAAALTAVIREDQPELAAQHPSETRRLRDLQRIREPGVKQGGGPRASRVLEVRADAIHGVRRVRHRVTSPRPHPTFMTESPLAACWPPRARVSRISNRCPSISGNRAAQRRVQLRRDVPGADAPDDPRARPLALRRHCRRGALPTVASI